MSLISNLCSSICQCSEEMPEHRKAERSMDASMRWAALGMIKGTGFWLLVSLVFGVIASMKLHAPGFISDSAWLTYGKVNPVFWNSLVYGFGFHAALAGASLVLVRLSGCASRNWPLLSLSIGAWNIGLAIGLFGILKGDQMPYRFLEMPAYVAPFLLAAFIGIGLWICLTFKNRIHRSSYAAQWHIVAATLSFAWIYTIAQTMLFCLPVQGSFQFLVSAWYADALFGLVLAPLAFGIIYYILPKALGVSIVGYRYAGTAFWTWILFNAFRGTAELINGPVPVWVTSIGVIASFGLLLPTVTLSIQFLSTLLANFGRIWDSLALRFVFVGVLSFTSYAVLEIYGSLRVTNDLIQFSVFDNGVKFLALVGFVGMTAFGAIYFFLPRLLNKRLPESLVDMHFWFQSIGLVTVTFALLSGGRFQGAMSNQSAASYATIANASKAFHAMTSIGMIFCVVGALLMLWAFISMIISNRSEDETLPTFIKESPDIEYNV